MEQEDREPVSGAAELGENPGRRHGRTLEAHEEQRVPRFAPDDPDAPFQRQEVLGTKTRAGFVCAQEAPGSNWTRHTTRTLTQVT